MKFQALITITGAGGSMETPLFGRDGTLTFEADDALGAMVMFATYVGKYAKPKPNPNSIPLPITKTQVRIVEV